MPDANFLSSICVKEKINADWLLLGIGPKYTSDIPSGRLNNQVLIDSIDTLEQVLQATGKEMAPADKAEIIAKIYELYVEETQGTDKEKFSNILKLVVNYD